MRKTWAILAVVLMFASVANAGGPPAHATIVILSDADFAGCACVTGGSGTSSDPYVIGPWTINGSGDAIHINGKTLTKSFVIPNLTAAGNGKSTDMGIVLENINPSASATYVAQVVGKQTTIQSESVAILISNSNGIVLDGGGSNPKGAGIGNTGAGALNKNVNGAIDVENSSNITIRGWQLSANGSDNSPDWVSLDPSTARWGVGGVRFFGVTNSTIDHNASNNCTDISYSLFHSSGNTVSNNTADYPFTMNFMIADGSVGNTLVGNVASTADFIGYMIADPLPGHGILETYGASHDNVLTGNISHTDGPTGNEINGGISPGFLGGFVVLNGAYNNHITNNQDWASTGTGFAWAQAVPANTPIGVATYPPVLHCNVTLSDGGGGVAKLNGNVWSGNVTQTIDACLPAQ